MPQFAAFLDPKGGSMRAVALGTVVVLTGFVIAAVAAPGRQEGIPSRGVPIQFYPSAANSDMIVVSVNVRDQYEQMTIIDPKRRTMAVYHKDFVTGEIAFRSSRHFEYDLELTQFNTKAPLPEEIRALLPPR
jgi:predicted amidohydrolase